MASSYPVGLDTGFPGWEYVDFIEYITAQQANAWISSFQAIEATIGAGQTTLSPLYSFAYAAFYTTLTARIAASEGKIVNLPKLNSNPANIQPVGVIESAGSTGLMADAGHVHVGQLTFQSLAPIGTIIPWPADPVALPIGWFECNGQQLSNTNFSALFAILGTRWGSGSGTFALPDCRDRLPVGVGSVIATQLRTGGTQTIGLTSFPNHTHTMSWAQSPHNHVSASSAQPGNPAFGAGFVEAPLPASVFYYNFGQNISRGSGVFSFNVTTDPFGTSTVGQTITFMESQNTGNNAPYAPASLGMRFIMRCL